MNRKEIEQEVSYCYPTRGEKLSENKDFCTSCVTFPLALAIM